MSINFIDREKELETLYVSVKPTEIPSRSITFLTGPVGIGKTTLAKKLIEKYYGGEDRVGIYNSLSRAYSSANAFLRDLIEQFNKQLSSKRETMLKILTLIANILKTYPIKSSKDIGELLENIVSQINSVEIKVSSIPYIFDNILEKLVLEISREGYGLIVIDEYQNLVKFLEAREDFLKVMFKRFMDLQEHYSMGRVKFLFITSDQVFYEKIISSTYPENIDTFYLGEMGRKHAIELFNNLMYGREYAGNDIEEYVDIIGGNPSNIYELVDRIKRYGKELRRSIRELYEKRLAHLNFLLNNMRNRDNPRLYAIFKRLLDYPLKLSEIPQDPDIRDVIRVLVENNILQYGCIEYMGIYNWRSTGGGICVINYLAPSNRLYYYALCELFGKDHPCRDLLRKIES